MGAYRLRTSLDQWVQSIGNSNNSVPHKFTGKEFYKEANAFKKVTLSGLIFLIYVTFIYLLY